MGSKTASEKKAPDARGFTYWVRPIETVLASLDSSVSGLSSGEAAERLTRYGPNTPSTQGKVTTLSLVLSQFRNPLLWLLIFAALVSGATQQWLDAVIIAIVVGSALLTFSQEYRANNTVVKLLMRVSLQATVRRDGEEKIVPRQQIVPGDIVLLTAGSLIPADKLFGGVRI